MPLTDVAIRNAKPRPKSYKRGDSLDLFLGCSLPDQNWIGMRSEVRISGASSVAPISNVQLT